MTFHPVPKPPVEVKERKKLRAKKWGVSDKPRKPLRKENPERAARRAEDRRKHYASKEYRAARKAQVIAAKGQCEFWFDYRVPSTGELVGHMRCPETERLQFHELHYGSDLGIIREIKGKMYCPRHHALVEHLDHPTRHTQRRRGA